MAAPLAHTHAANPHWLPRLAGSDLAHVPGEDGLPVLGVTPWLLADPHGYGSRLAARHGRVFRTHSFGNRQVSLLGPEANEFVLFDRDQLFSSEQGWGPTLNLLFPRGLMLLDFEAHRADRKVLGVAFKPEPMRHYAAVMNRAIPERLARWAGRPIRFYDAIKQLTLDVAAEAFLGIGLGEDADRINRAFVAMVAAAVGVVRSPLPGTRMRAGVRGRAELVQLFGRLVPERREGGGHDLFSRVCRATDEDGRHLSTDAIVDHMTFLLMAAHDTTTSALTSLLFLLGGNRGWIAPLADEARALAAGVGDAPTPEQLDALELADRAFREALRLVPPVPSIPRRALRPFSFGGFDFPAGTRVSVSPGWTHRDPAIWPDPERFDPDRFLPDAVRTRHRFAWVPFGGGAHMCIGLHFALLQARLFAFHLFRGYRMEPGWPAGGDWRDRWIQWPIPKPRDRLPLTFRAL